MNGRRGVAAVQAESAYPQSIIPEMIRLHRPGRMVMGR
jgi:hypothetical protein